MAEKRPGENVKDIISVFKVLSNTDRSVLPNERIYYELKSNFEELLLLNLFLLRRKLESDFKDVKSFSKITKIVNFVFAQNIESGTNGTNVRWIFSEVCLEALYLLRSILHNTSSSRSISMDLSIGDQQIVKTVIQLITVLKVYPNLVDGVGVAMEMRSEFAHSLKAEEKKSVCSKCLHKCVSTLIDCLNEPSLSVVILSKHLCDILTSLMQLGYCKESIQDHSKQMQTSFSISSASLDMNNENKCNVNNKEKIEDVTKTDSNKVNGIIVTSSCCSDENLTLCGDSDASITFSVCEGGLSISKIQQKMCQKSLNKIVDKIYQPLIVRELLFLQGNMLKKPHGKKTETPKWMKNICGHLLSRCLIKKNGILNVLTAVFEGVSGLPSEWKICETISEVISNCPLQMKTVKEYYWSISYQLLPLLHLPSSKLQYRYCQAVVMTIHAMLRKYPEIATKCLTEPLAKPFFLACQEQECVNGDLSKGNILLDETQITQSIEGLHKVFVATTECCAIMNQTLSEIIIPVFELFCFVKQSVSYIKTALLEILSTFFKRTDKKTSLLSLYMFICKERPSVTMQTFLFNFTHLSMEEVNKSTDGHPPSENYGDYSDITIAPSEVIDTKMLFMRKDRTFVYGENGGVILIKINPVNEETVDDIYEELLGKGEKCIEMRALCLVEILQTLRNDVIPGNFFLFLLQQVQEIIFDSHFYERDKKKVLLIFHVLAVMCEKLGPSVLKNTAQMIQFIGTTLTRAHRVSMERREDAMFEMETLSMSLGMLSALLSGAVKIEDADYAKLEKLTPILRNISESYDDHEVSEQANDLLVFILTKTTILSEKNKKLESNNLENGQGSKRNEIEGTDFDTAFKQLCDPLLPVRGHAIIRLAALIKSGDKIALGNIDILVKTFHDNLVHEDSYIYLAAIEGLVAAADVRMDDVITYLVTELTNSVQVNMVYRRDCTQLNKGKENKEEVIQRSSNIRLKLGEALLRVVKCCGYLAPKYFHMLIHVYLVGVRDEDSLIRASSLSNLGEICQLSPHMVSNVIEEILHCLHAVLKSDHACEVRQAGVFVITLLFKGLKSDLITELSDQIKSVYRLLKLVISADGDMTTRTHAQVALGVLDNIMKDQLFPEQKYTKNIRI